MNDATNEIKSLIITRCIAHQAYLSRRILKDSKRIEFEDTMNEIINYLISSNTDYNDVDTGNDKHGGVNMALELFNEISLMTWQRFSMQRTGDFYLEKL